MAFADWTVTAGTWALDATEKHTGNSSVRQTGAGGTLRHATFSYDQVYVRFWSYSITGADVGIVHASYGAALLATPIVAGWRLFEFWFWYDPAGNTKWGRSAVDGVPNVDVNKGVGAPAAELISITSTGANQNFDDVELWA